MLRAFVQRMVQFVVVLFLVTFGTTELINLAPGSPCYIIIGADSTPAAIAACAKQYGYNRPVLDQYWQWLDHALHGNLGTSVQAQIPVVSVIKQALPISLEIAIFGFVGSMVLGVGLALVSALRPGGILDRFVTAISSLFIALPPIVSLPLFVYLFALKLHLFPPASWVSLSTSISGNLSHVALPAITLVVAATYLPLRLLRGDLAAVLSEDYITSARARGLPEWYVILRHAFRPASLSLLTISGVLFGFLIAGNIVIETFFTDPGVGYAAYFGDTNLTSLSWRAWLASPRSLTCSSI
jgi:peptide/nickel transport system permease protein